MKKLMILAMSAILVANVSAQEQKKECKKLSKEDRVEFDIRRYSHELFLSDEQKEQFAATYRAYADELDKLFEKNAPKKLEPGKELSDKELDELAKKRFEGFKALADVQAKYYDKFRKTLSARQVEKVLQFQAPCGPQEFDHKPCCDKHDGKKCGKHKDPKCGKHAGPCPEGPSPKFPESECPSGL